MQIKLSESSVVGISFEMKFYSEFEMHLDELPRELCSKLVCVFNSNSLPINR